MAGTDASSARAFWTFERDGWNGAAEAYRDYFGNLTTQTVVPLLDAAGVGAGTRLLDVAIDPLDQLAGRVSVVESEVELEAMLS